MNGRDVPAFHVLQRLEASAFGTLHHRDRRRTPNAAQPAHPHFGLAARDEAHAQQMLDRWLALADGAELVRWSRAAPA